MIASFVICSWGDSAHAEKTALNLSPSYAQTTWPSGHRDSGNTDYVPMVMARDNRIKARLLEGHPIFWPPVAGPRGQFYVTSGKGPGHSHLHAFDSDGRLLWRAPPQQSLDDLDSYAIIDAPVVDRAGDVYVGDRNQLWAFHADGTLKWVVELTQYGVDWGFMSVVISTQGHVGGISSNGKVIFFRARDGALAMPVLDLPGGDGPPAQDTPPRFLWKGLMDPAIKPFMFNLIQGWEMEVANTPARHPVTGRIYITAAGSRPDRGLLYGIDVHEDRLEIAFQTEMGGGSGTSPAVSQDGRRVYALDELGRMIAVDAVSGRRLWQTREGGGGSASPSVGADETIYTAFQDHLLAFHEDGLLKWEGRYNHFCAERIPELGGFWGWLFSEPAAFVDSLFTVAESEGWLNIVCGRHPRWMPSGSNRTRVPVPLSSYVVAIDLASGEPLGEPLKIPETSEGFVMPTLDGNTFVTLSGAITSIFYHMLNPILPESLEVPEQPRAGLLLLEPESRRALALDGVKWLQGRFRAAREANAVGDVSAAIDALRRASLQMAATRAALGKAAESGELAPNVAGLQQARLSELEVLQQDTQETLRAPVAASAQAIESPTTQLEAAEVLLRRMAADLQSVGSVKQGGARIASAQREVSRTTRSVGQQQRSRARRQRWWWTPSFDSPRPAGRRRREAGTDDGRRTLPSRMRSGSASGRRPQPPGRP